MALENWSFGRKNDDTPWPNDDDGNPISPVFLSHLRATDMEGPIVIGMLESAGIPVVTQYPNGGAFGKIILGFPGTGLDLYVPATLLEVAKGMLEGDFEEDENLV